MFSDFYFYLKTSDVKAKNGQIFRSFLGSKRLQRRGFGHFWAFFDHFFGHFLNFAFSFHYFRMEAIFWPKWVKKMAIFGPFFGFFWSFFGHF